MVRGLSLYAAVASARRIVVDQGVAKADEVCCLCFEETGTATNWKIVSFPDDASAALQGASFMDCRKDQGDGTSKCAAACADQGFEMKGCNKGAGMSEWRENELWATGTWSCATDAEGDSCGCPESSLIEQQNSRSFPTAIWDEVEDESPSCEELMGEAQNRMKDYMQTCGLNPQTDRDSGATSFTLFKSGAEKLCNCDLDTESIKDAAKAMADCPTTQMSGPLKVLDNTYLECKAGSLKLSDYKEKDGKLADEGSLIAVKAHVAKADEVCCLCFEETGTTTNWKIVSFPDDASAALQGASFMDCRKDQGDGTSKCAAACADQGFEMKGCNKGAGMSEWRENELWATGTWSCATDAEGDSCGCPV